MTHGGEGHERRTTNLRDEAACAGYWTDGIAVALQIHPGIGETLNRQNIDATAARSSGSLTSSSSTSTAVGSLAAARSVSRLGAMP